MAYWSYSQLALYKKCPLKFKWQRIDKRPMPPWDGKNAFIGNLLQKIVERFYVEEWWRDPHHVSERMLAEIPPVARQMTEAEGVKWLVGEQEKWISVALDTVPKIIEVIKAERLLGTTNLSEYEIKVPIRGDLVVGRVDFIFEHPNGDVTVLDGKAGGSFGKYVEADQLRLYSLGLLHSQFKRLPTRVGFWWYRHARIAWRPVSRKVLDKFEAGVQATISKVRARDYRPKPGGHCHFCEWKTDCTEGKQWLWRNQKTVAIESEGNTGTTGFD